MKLRTALRRAADANAFNPTTENKVHLARLILFAYEYGATYRQITEACGWTSVSTAHHYASTLREATDRRSGAVLDDELPSGFLR